MAEVSEVSSKANTVVPLAIPYDVKRREVPGFTGSGMVRTMLALILYHWCQYALSKYYTPSICPNQGVCWDNEETSLLHVSKPVNCSGVPLP
jgi:hypothetical protein